MPSDDINKRVKKCISDLESLKAYNIRELVKHAEEFGPYLKNNRLETNQIRKFLDAINRIKAQTIQDDGTKVTFDVIETEIVLLKPKLAYAAARQSAVKPLSEVMAIAIDKTRDLDDFARLVQFIESTIAYHKAQGGR